LLATVIAGFHVKTFPARLDPLGEPFESDQFVE
jgi:hypothetical protein